MKIIRSGTAEESLQEQLKLIFFQASNKSLFVYDGTARTWPFMLKIIQLIDSAGFMRVPLDPGEDVTLLAAREELFQQTFRSMSWICARPKPRPFEFQGPLLDIDIRTITRFVKWLLQSGQDPNIPLRCASSCSTSALQVALECRLENLAGILLQYNADVHGRLPDLFPQCMRHCWMHLPPLVLAIASSSKSNNDTLLSKFENHEALLVEFLSSMLPQRPKEWEDTYGPDKDHLLYMMMTRPYHEHEALSVLRYIKRKLGSARLQTSEHNQGLLYSAARSGSVDILLDFVLENSVDINITNRSGATVLHNVVLGPHSVYKTCRYLLEHGAVLDSSTADMSAFHLACSKVDDVEVLQLFHAHGSSIYSEIPVTHTATKSLSAGRYLQPEQRLAILEATSTPFKAALNNPKLDPYELNQFCLQVARSDPKTIECMIDASLQSGNAELLLLALRADEWQAVRSNRWTELLRTTRWTELLRTTIQCCDEFLGNHSIRTCCMRLSRDARINIAHELLNAGVDIGPGDAVRAARLGDWDLVRRIWTVGPTAIALSTIPHKTGTISFLEATILWCPFHALEITQISPYTPKALCAAAQGVCTDKLELDVVEALLKNRSFCDDSTQDTPMEMAAIGIALYNDKTRLLEILRKHLPAQSLACLPTIYDPYVGRHTITLKISQPLWWHAARNFHATIQQYGWDTTCLSLLVKSRDYEKVELLMKHKMLRQKYVIFNQFVDLWLFPPLYYSMGDPKLIQACIHLGECVNGDDPWSKQLGFVPLMAAVRKGSLSCVDLLLEFGADVNQAGRNIHIGNGVLETPLMKACSYGYLAIAKRLIEHGADMSFVNDDGWTPLVYAAWLGRIDTIQLLLSEGEDTVGKDLASLRTAILKASSAGHMAAVKLIRAHVEEMEREYMGIQKDDDDDEDNSEENVDDAYAKGG
jgi:ankyrin repeat protein